MKLTAVVWNNQKAYFFKDGSYIRYDIVGDYADAGYPGPIAGNWPPPNAGAKLPPEFEKGIDAAVVWPNGKAYFFKGDQYVRYNMNPQTEGVEFVGPIKGHWPPPNAGAKLPPEFEKGIDAAVVWPNGKAYFFKGDQYVRYNINPQTEGVEFVGPIKGHWPPPNAGAKLPPEFEKGIDAAVVWPNGKAYFFKGDQYVRYNMNPQTEGVEFVGPIKGNWCGLFGGPFGDPDVTIVYSQPANFFVFDKTPGEVPDQSTSPGGNGMFMVYRIESIQNNSPLFTGSGFNFMLASLFANKRDERSGSTSLDQYLKSAPIRRAFLLVTLSPTLEPSSP